MTNTIEIKKTNAIAAWKGADKAGKKLLEDLLGKLNVSGNIIDMTPSVEAALELAGKSLDGLKKPGDTKHEYAQRVIEAVIEVLWEGVKVDHSNSSQDKFEPRFYYKSGLGLSYDDYVRWNTGTFCGPRLCYPSYDTMLHGIKILKEFYNNYLN